MINSNFRLYTWKPFFLRMEVHLLIIIDDSTYLNTTKINVILLFGD